MNEQYSNAQLPYPHVTNKKVEQQVTSKQTFYFVDDLTNLFMTCFFSKTL